MIEALSGHLTWQFIERIGVALAIGALLGMEREYTKHQVVVGVRTFALVSLLGALFVLFGEMTGSQISVLLGFIAVMLLVAVLYASNLFKFKAVGMTTSIALLMSYALGVFVAYGNITEAVFVTIAVALVMFTKNWLHSAISALKGAEVLDFLEFLALVGIVYPLVPHEPVMLYSVAVNVMDIWTLLLMLALINFAGFVGSRYVSGKRQMELMGMLGGLVSSNAAMYSMTQAYGKSKGKEQILASAYTFINASAFVRNIVILSVLAPTIASLVLFPALAAALALIAGGLWMSRKTPGEMQMELESPFQVAKAARLVLKLSVVLVALSAAVVYLPDIFYVATFFGGLVSTASTMASLPGMVEAGRITVRMAALGASIAMMSDLLVGNVIVYHLGGAGKAARKALPVGIAAMAVYGLVLSFML